MKKCLSIHIFIFIMYMCKYKNIILSTPFCHYTLRCCRIYILILYSYFLPLMCTNIAYIFAHSTTKSPFFSSYYTLLTIHVARTHEEEQQHDLTCENKCIFLYIIIFFIIIIIIIIFIYLYTYICELCIYDRVLYIRVGVCTRNEKI